MADVAASVVRHRRWIVAGCLVLCGVLLPLVPQVADKLQVGTAAVHRDESAVVDDLLATRFDSPFSSSLVLVVSGIPSLEDTDGIDALTEISEAVSANENVAAVFSYLDAVDPMFVGPDTTFILVGLAAHGRPTDEVVPELRAMTHALETQMRPAYPGLRLAWTGGAAFDYDVRLTSAEDAADAEHRVLPVTLVLLFIVFGSVVGAIFPISIGALGVGLTLGAVVLLSPYWPMVQLLRNIVTMIGLGIGIDYTLLMLSRFREEMEVSADPERAAAATLRSAGRTVILSGGAVAIGFAGLLVIPATELRSIATGGLLVVGFCVLLATLLLPALFAWLGSRVELGRLWRARTASRPSVLWQKWGRWVVAHPLSIVIVVGLPLATLAWQARHISTDIPTGNWLPKRMESTLGAVALQDIGQSGIVQAIFVVVEFPAGQSVETDAGWQTIVDLGRRFESDGRVARVVSVPNLLGLQTGAETHAAVIPAALRSAYVSDDGQLGLIEIIPRESASAGQLMRYARELRDTRIAGHAAMADIRLLVGGLPARNAEHQDAVGENVMNALLLIVGASFLALLIGFRSLLGAFKALALNILSVAAAMGVTVLVFQLGYGAHWLGIEPLDGLFPDVPVIVFCIVFGLSMDYEVFLLARVAEGVRNGKSNDDALVDGLAKTGGVITSAALVMIVVFASFSLGDFLIIKILGFTLAVAVLIDATVVRLALGPALLQLGGRWNWWPGRVPAPLRPDLT